jgi:hypothetical protein
MMMITHSSLCNKQTLWRIVNNLDSMDTRTITRKRAPNTPTRIVWVALIVEGTREMKFRIMPEELINQVMKSSKIHIVIDNESKIITEI